MKVVEMDFVRTRRWALGILVVLGLLVSDRATAQLLAPVTGGDDVTLNEINEAAEIITEGAAEDAQILFGAVVDESLGDQLQVTVIATGFQREQESIQMPAPRASADIEPMPRRDEPAAARSSRFFVPGGPNTEYGINQTDDFEIPAILRKQMD